jgi:hypothetical protein
MDTSSRNRVHGQSVMMGNQDAGPDKELPDHVVSCNSFGIPGSLGTIPCAGFEGLRGDRVEHQAFISTATGGDLVIVSGWNCFSYRTKRSGTSFNGTYGSAGKVYQATGYLSPRMHAHVVEKVKGFLLKPSATFQATRTESLTSTFQYYVILLVIFSILYAIVSFAITEAFFTYYANLFASFGLLGAYGPGVLNAFRGFGAALTLFIAYFFFLVLLFGIFLDGFFYHVFVILFAGKKGLVQTVKTVMYASTPFFIIGWIPYVSIIGLIWAWILIIIGIKENQEMELGRAILVFVVPLVLTLIFILATVAVIGSFYSALMSILPGTTS